jgi:hypothetical protein
MQLFRSDHADFAFPRVVHVVRTVELPAQPHLQNVRFGEQPFLDGASHRRAVRILRSPILIPGIGVRVELHESHGSMLGMDSAQNGEQNRMITTDAERNRFRVEDGLQPLLDAAVSFFD